MEQNAKFKRFFMAFHLKIISSLQKSCKNKNSIKYGYTVQLYGFTY